MQRPKTNKQPELSLVIPAYCEEQRIGYTLDQLARFLKQDSFFKDKHVEVLVVAADAPDKTQKIVANKQVLFADLTLLKPGSRVGKGHDVQYGMIRATGRIVAFMDADLATPLHHLQKFYEACKSGCNVVVGTRNLLTYRHNTIRGLFAYLGNALYRLAGGINVEDTQCGFKMFTADAAKICFHRQTILGWGFDVEILAIAKTNRLRIKSYRLDDWQHMPYSTYTENMFGIARRTIGDFARITLNRVSGSYHYQK